MDGGQAAALLGQVREGQTGIFLPPGDEAAWCDALVTTADISPEQRPTLGEAGTRFVRERFSTERIVEEFIDLLGPGRSGEVRKTQHVVSVTQRVPTH